MLLCGFWGEEDGTISRVEVFKGVSEELDEEAVRVIDIMSKWEPARRGDKKVRMRYSMPIIFKYYCPLKILSRIRDFENFFF